MKVTILTLTFPPEPAQHILDLAKGLVHRGHMTTVLTSLPSYPFGRIYEGYRNKFYSAEIWDGVKIIRLPVLPSHSPSFLKRGLFYLTSSMSILVYLALTMARPADVTIAYLPPLSTAFPALIMKKLRKAKFMVWIHDMWPETLEEAGVKNKKILAGIGRAADHIYRKASHIMVLSDGFKSNLIGKGVPDGKISTIPNWSDPAAPPLQMPNKEDFAQFGLQAGRFYILYAGNLGEMQALEAVIDAYSLMPNEPDIMLLLLGTGTRKEKLMRRVDERNLADRVRFLGRVSPEEVPAYYALADALIVHIRDSKLFQITIPHKIYEYMLAAKPVIAAIRGDARAEVLRAGVGLACEPQDPKSIADAILELKRLPAEERAAMGRRGRRFLLDHRTPKVLIDRIEGILEDVQRS